MIGYNEPEDLIEYATLRGVTITEEQAPILLTRALDWLELQKFKGVKYDQDQTLEFPRVPENYKPPEPPVAPDVPVKITTAQLVCAMIYKSGGDPLAAITPQVTQETVVGAVSVSYSDKGGDGTSKVLYPQLEALLREYLDKAGDGNFIKLGQWV